MAQDRIQEFMQRMAARYIPGRRAGDDMIELRTTDTGRTYRVRITPERCELNAPEGDACAARIETTESAFIDMLEGRMNPMGALLRGKVKVKGDLALLKTLPGYFKKDE